MKFCVATNENGECNVDLLMGLFVSFIRHKQLDSFEFFDYDITRFIQFQLWITEATNPQSLE